MEYYQIHANNERTDPLCCCEYINENNERFHILACCCNCVDVDENFDRLITCRGISNRNISSMLITLQDRLRVPWRGGAKLVTLDVVLPMILIVLINFISSINHYCALVIFIAFPIMLGYANVNLIKIMPRTKFFSSWSTCSAIYLLLVFEFNVPLLELLPEENFAFIVLLIITTLCYYKTYRKSQIYSSIPNIMSTSENNESHTSLIMSDKDESDENDAHNACPICNKYIMPRSYHNYNKWLYCCIGKHNHRTYILGCVFAVLSLILYIYLVITTICHSFPVSKQFSIYILLPDDCSDVFEQFDLGVSFVGSLYAGVLLIYITFILLKQLCLISRVDLYGDIKLGDRNRRSCIFNWISFCFGSE